MFEKGLSFLRELASGASANKDGSLLVTDSATLARFTGDPEFPWLISFPRTGSHWLRMVMELYFEKPSLVRVFYFKDAKEFTCYHRHDEDLTVQGVRNVIYLYRDPVDTVYSQMNYYKEDTDDIPGIEHWSGLYGRHLSKWLFDERFTEKKTVIAYEGLKASMPDEFEKVCSHLGQVLDRGRLEGIIGMVSKEELKKKTSDNNQIVNLTDRYQTRREEFRQNHGGRVMDIVRGCNSRTAGLFGG